MLARLGGMLYRTRWLVLFLALLIVAGAAVFGTGLFGSLKSGGFNDPASESSRAEALLDTKLGGATADIVILMSNNSLKATDTTFMDAATKMLETLKARPEVASVISYYSTHSASLVSRDGHETFAVVQLKAKDEAAKEKDFKTIEPLITSPVLHTMVGGNVAVNIAINKQVSSDLERAELITFPIVAILLVIVFDSLVAASLPLLIGGIAIMGAFAILRAMAGWTDVSVYAVNVVTMLGLGLAIDYALFIVTRFREELGHGKGDVKVALERTMATAGRTVAFSGLTVSTSLLGLMLFPEMFLRSMSMGAIAATLVSMLAALTILPALLAVLGHRINALSIQSLFQRKSLSQRQDSSNETQGAWYRIAEMVMRRPVVVGLAVLAILVTLGLPFWRVAFSTPDVKVLASNQEARIVSDRLSRDFAQQGNSQLVVVMLTPGDALSSANLASLDSYVRSIKEIPGVVSEDSVVTLNASLTLADYQQLYAHPGANPQLTAIATQLANGDTTKITIAMQPADHTTAAENIVSQVRAIHAPGGLVPLVDGVTAYQIDLLASLRATLPYALLVMFAAVSVLLFLMTGSLLMPVKAIVLNILSLSATFGALVWIFQDGHLQNLLGFQSTGSIDATQPILIFAIAFGLSMDYEVFLLSRIKERFDETGDNRAAVSSGLQRTGWLITSAAMLMAVVFSAFGTSRIIFIQEIGIGLAIAVIIDATLVRMLLVPATMRLLGKWNWWAPAPLRAIWQRIGLSESSVAAGNMVGSEETLTLGEIEREKAQV
ncbi:MAG TPA: MMPL family transporter [Ktedonobacteraceae bacterium]|nr:MMPL family transporter [Ktedonobacteraceae bacterium]